MQNRPRQTYSVALSIKMAPGRETRTRYADLDAARLDLYTIQLPQNQWNSYGSTILPLKIANQTTASQSVHVVPRKMAMAL